jgi:hypothetical protein
MALTEMETHRPQSICPPTRSVNPAATTNRPLSDLSGSAASDLGAGPKITFAAFLGS